MTIDRHSKFLGAMIGSAIGDAIGELANQVSGREALIEQIDEVEGLRYTEVTVTSSAIAEMLIELDGIDIQRLGNTLRERFLAEPWRGYGEGSRRIFASVEKEGIGYLDAARRLHDGEGSWGCGAAAHILPVALYHHREESLYERVEEVARLTHAHPIGVDGAAVLARAEVKALHLNFNRPFSPAVIIERLGALSRTSTLRGKLQLIPELIEHDASPWDAAETLGLGLGAHESVPFALYCFLHHPHTFVETVLTAVLQGGSRPGLGAMAGALSGAYLGIEAIPGDWLERLESHQHIETLARELAARTGD